MARRDEWLRTVGIPARYRAASFTTLSQTHALTAVTKFHESNAWKQGPGARALLLCGPTGTGKTAAAAALVVELLAHLRSHQRFVHASALARRTLDYRRADEAINEMTTTSLLVIDDIDPGFEQRALTSIEEVIITREAEARALVITSNATPDRLARVFSDRVVDRLRAWGDIVECVGPSLRKRPGPNL